MRYQSSIWAVALAAAVLASPSAAQVVDFGKYPDFKGQWARTGNPNNWHALAGPAPLTPEYQKVFADIQADLKAGGAGNWPSTFCIPAGMPAMMSFYDPAEIIVMPQTTYILISHNDDSYRRIYTDGRDWQVGRRGRRRQVQRARGRNEIPQIAAELRYLGNPVSQRRTGCHQGAYLSRQGRPGHAL